jgi:hypothetical protein
MEINELQIGDWVEVSGIPRQIKLIDDCINHKIIAHGVNNDGRTIAYVGKLTEEVKPIPLTPEILEKNGNGIRGYAVWDLDCGAEVQWVRETLDDINPSMQYRLAPRQKNFGIQETLICHIEYVHQLQHALRLCGIKKEITL